MNLPLKIAKRYLFAKRSTNAINIISGIAVLGVAVGTAALVLILSVFNGFEDLITGMYSKYNPDIEITPAKGKIFEPDSLLFAQLDGIEGIKAYSVILEEVAYFEYKNNAGIGILRGVDDNFQQVLPIDSTIREGRFDLHGGNRDFAVFGLGMRNKLGINVDDDFSAASVYMPKAKKAGSFGTRFTKRSVYPVGTFAIQQEFNQQYVFASLPLVRSLLKSKKGSSMIQVKLAQGHDTPATHDQIRQTLGKDFVVKNRFQQQAAFLKLMQVEKWLSFAVVSLMMILVSFNLIGALWMIVLEKKQDITTLKAIGASNNVVYRIFLFEGLLLTGVGLLVGFVVAIIVYTLQKQFELVTVPGNFMTTAYPIAMRWYDFITVSGIVGLVGLLAALTPANKAQKIAAIIREE